MSGSGMRKMQALGTEFWNDSCELTELRGAVEQGAVGATSNPVIVYNVIKADQKNMIPALDRLIGENSHGSEDELAWKLIESLAVQAAGVLEAVYKQSSGQRGYLSVQVNPGFYRSAEQMIAHGKGLAALAPNIGIKAPCTQAGIHALEELTASGIRVNATVSFSVSQAIAAAEAVERGLKKAIVQGIDVSKIRPNITVMVGRLDDHLQRVMAKNPVMIDPGYLHWAGVAVVKKAYDVFMKRDYRSTLLVAAYRHHLHWSQLIGERVAQTIPYSWWKQFNDSAIPVEKTIRDPVDPRIIDALLRGFPDFRKAYEEDGLSPGQFDSYGPSVHTLNQFVNGYHDLLGLVRERRFS